MQTDKQDLQLQITSSEKEKIEAKIIGRNVTNIFVSKTDRSSQSLLPLIEKALEVSNSQLTSLTGITVSTGPGSYTGLRVGVVIGIVLSWLFDIPINGNTPGTIPQITYQLRDKYTI